MNGATIRNSVGIVKNHYINKTLIFKKCSVRELKFKRKAILILNVN